MMQMPLLAPNADQFIAAGVGAAITVVLLAVIMVVLLKSVRAANAEKADDILRKLQSAQAGAQAGKETDAAIAKLQREVSTLSRNLDELGEGIEGKIDQLAKSVKAAAAKPAAAPARPPKPAARPAAEPSKPSAAKPEPAAPKPATAAKPAAASGANVDYEEENGILKVIVHFREVKRPEAQELVGGVFDRTSDKTDRIMVDLSEVAYVNSSGLSAITKIAVERDCRLVLTAEDVIKVMDLMGFLPLLTICATQEEALRSFQG
jgi:anti-anti-sigma regulatory factor/type II secretory pathway pseudopilin PulG